jgi:uncharacterized protein
MEVFELYWYDHALFFLTAVVIPFISVMARPLPDSISEESSDYQILPPKKHLYYQNGLVLVIGALLVLTTWNAADRKWSALGFDWIQMNTVVVFSVVILCAFYLVDLFQSIYQKEATQEKLKDLQQILPLNWNEYRHYIFLAMAAGICEEIIFRGFLINYLNTLLVDLDYSTVYAIAIPAVTFGLSHWYQGKAAVLKIMFISLLFGVIFVWSGSLYLIMAIHVAIDLISGMSGMWINKNPQDNDGIPSDNADSEMPG